MKKYICDKATYRSIRKSREAFDSFCTELYKTAYMDGRNDVKGTDVSDILKTIKGVKGIGPVLSGRIEAAINKKFGGNT